jgi:hypothetical protein
MDQEDPYHDWEEKDDMNRQKIPQEHHLYTFPAVYRPLSQVLNHKIFEKPSHFLHQL